MTGTDEAVLEIDLAGVVANWRLLGARHAGPVGAVLKADAYGLGAGHVADALHAAGCRHGFTAHLTEAVAIRPHWPGRFLAVLHGLRAGEEADFLAHGLVPVLGSLGEIDRWTECARRLGRQLPAVLHIDTGMNRLGLDAPGLAALAADPARLGGIALAYVMTHLTASEVPQDPINAIQRARFAAACAALPAAPRSFANSSGIFLGPGFASDLARPGAALYGLNPIPGQPNPMRPVVRLTAPVIALRDIAAGEPVGYNATWRAVRPSRIATVAVGYADGWLRAHSNRGFATFDGAPVPLIGRVSMDLSTFDATDHPRLGLGDRLELIGATRTADAVADAAGTNGYEVLTSLGRRYTRTWRT